MLLAGVLPAIVLESFLVQNLCHGSLTAPLCDLAGWSCLTLLFSQMPPLQGIVVLDAGTGALLFQRRFVPNFGMIGEDTAVDPVGLALQFFAFTKFCENVPGVAQLRNMRIGPDTGAQQVSFAVTVPLEAAPNTVTLALALFNTLRPRNGLPIR